MFLGTTHGITAILMEDIPLMQTLKTYSNSSALNFKTQEIWLEGEIKMDTMGNVAVYDI